MSSKALYLSKLPPKLMRRFDAAASGRAIEIWTTSCIVLNLFDRSEAGDNSKKSNATSTSDVLINPSNPQLTGTSNFSYFPRGGPVPTKMPQISAHHIMPYVSQWGGIEVEHGMMFDTSVMDGMVHLYGGWGLQTELMWKRARVLLSNDEACPVGQAVLTSSGNDRLATSYDHIIHTTPPFYRHCKDGDPEDLLRQCYANALRLANDKDRIATPILGAGCRGFPVDVAFDIAAESAAKWLGGENAKLMNGKEQVLIFGLLEKEWAEDLNRLLENRLSTQ